MSYYDESDYAMATLNNGDGIKILYRFEDGIDSGPFASVNKREMRVVKETVHGYWILLHSVFDSRRWVPKHGKNLFAFDTEEEAMFNYMKRKERQIKILSHKLQDAKARLAIMRAMLRS